MRSIQSQAALILAVAAMMTCSVACSQPRTASSAPSSGSVVTTSAAAQSSAGRSVGPSSAATKPAATAGSQTASSSRDGAQTSGAKKSASKTQGHQSTEPSSGSSGPETQEAVLQSLPGTSSAQCAVVGGKSDMRAGTLAAGNFAEMRKQYASQAKTKAQPQVSMYVIPQDVSRLTGVSVTLDPLNAKAKSRTFKTDAVNTADEWRYYRVDLTVPSPGTWRMTAVSGKDKGCFEVTFGP